MVSKLGTKICEQISTNFKILAGVVLFSGGIISSVVLFCYLTGKSIGTFTRDPNALAGIPFYSGCFSQLGNMFWFVTAAILFFTTLNFKGKFGKFLFFSGILTLTMGTDDLFLIHDGLFNAIGISGKWIYVFYAVFAGFYFNSFYSQILKTPFILLFSAFGFLGLSALSDLIVIPGIHPYVFEDGFKMMGIVSWGVYFYKVCVTVLKTSAIETKVVNINRVKKPEISSPVDYKVPGMVISAKMDSK